MNIEGMVENTAPTEPAIKPLKTVGETAVSILLITCVAYPMERLRILVGRLEEGVAYASADEEVGLLLLEAEVEVVI
jgi:hypothetical protein